MRQEMWTAEQYRRHIAGPQLRRHHTVADQSSLFIHAWRLLAPKDLPYPEAEYRFSAPRRWRFDWAWPAPLRVAVEVDGGRYAFAGGRHGSDGDREKMSSAAILGWKVLRFSPTMLKTDPVKCVRMAVEAIRNAGLASSGNVGG